jgi:hypothetical protein
MAGFSDLDSPQTTKAVTAAYTLTTSDMVVTATAGSAYAVTLPPLASVPIGHTVVIAKDGGANAITVTPAGSEKINNIAATLALASGGTNGHAVTLMSISTTWVVVGSI